VFVVEGGLEAIGTTGTEPLRLPELAAPVPTIDVPRLVALLASGDRTAVIDLARSIDFREGHIPGALWGVRSRLARLQPQIRAARDVVITSPDGLIARLAVDEVKTLTRSGVRALEGGTEAWKAFGRPLVKDRTTPPDEECIDFYLHPYDRNSGLKDAMMNAYRAWIDMVNQIWRDDTISFGVDAGE
jgi:3-mercaptopyruvate sulfurtransferase SseA